MIPSTCFSIFSFSKYFFFSPSMYWLRIYKKKFQGIVSSVTQTSDSQWLLFFYQWNLPEDSTRRGVFYPKLDNLSLNVWQFYSWLTLSCISSCPSAYEGTSVPPLEEEDVSMIIADVDLLMWWFVEIVGVCWDEGSITIPPNFSLISFIEFVRRCNVNLIFFSSSSSSPGPFS